MPYSKHLLIFCLVILSALFVSACSEEKALALKTAAEAFRDKSVEAIDSFYELHIVAETGRQSEAMNTQESIRQIKAVASDRKTVNEDDINGALAWMSARSEAEARLQKLQQLKQAYNEFSAAFSRLPQGSAFAGDAIACSTALGSRLVYRLIELHDILLQAPIDYFNERAAAEVAIDDAARSGNPVEVEKATLAYIELRKTIQRDNQETLGKLAQAAEAGHQVLELTRNYNSLEVKDFLVGITNILALRASYLGASDSSLERVQIIRKQLESDPKLVPILNLPTVSMIRVCEHN